METKPETERSNMTTLTGIRQYTPNQTNDSILTGSHMKTSLPWVCRQQPGRAMVLRACGYELV